jgi:hypothetical protein
MTRRTWIIGVAAGVLGLLLGAGIGASGKSATKTVTVAGRVVTEAHVVRAPTRTVTRVVVHTHTVTTPAPTEAASASTDCNDLPASASTNLSEIRESRCEMEKLNADNPSAANEHEIETMISDERAIEASE